MTETEGYKTCPFCFEQVRAEAIKCRYCGSDLRSTPGSPGAPSEPSRMTLGTSLKGTLETGTVLGGKYEVLDIIGRGGMGCVYQAREIEFNVDRTVAIKVLPLDMIDDERVARRFEEEIKIAARMDHPNIIPIYSIGREGPVLFFVMKFMHGRTLKQMIRASGWLPEKRLRDVGRQISDAIHYLHKNGIIHRDIKSNNIMVDENGHAMLMDFGIAKAYGSSQLTTSGEILGTAPYMSPEQWDGQIDHRSDIYSFGVVLYEMATGDLPFRSESTTELMRMVISSPPPSPRSKRPELSADLVTVIERSLEKKADRRYQTMGDLKDAIEGARVRDVEEEFASSSEPTVPMQRSDTDSAPSDPSTDLEPAIPDPSPIPESPPVPANDVAPIAERKTPVVAPTPASRASSSARDAAPVWLQPVFLIPGAVATVVVLFLIVFPIVAPYPASLALEGMGDGAHSLGFYLGPPVFNAEGLYKRSMALRSNKTSIEQKIHEVYRYYQKWGDHHYAAGNYKKALRYYRNALSVEPNNPEAQRDVQRARAKTD